MVGVQPDVDRGHPGVVRGRRTDLRAVLLLLEEDEVTPVGERDARLRRRGDGLTEHDEVGHGRAAEIRRARAGAGQRGGRTRDDRVGGDLATEQRQLGQVGARLDRRAGAALGAPAGHRRGLQHRAVGRVGEGAVRAARPGRRRVLACDHGNLTRELDLDAVLRRPGRRLRRRPARTGQRADDHRGGDDRQEESDGAAPSHRRQSMATARDHGSLHARQPICAATRTSKAPNRRLRTSAGSDSARKPPATTPPIPARPRTSDARQRTLP